MRVLVINSVPLNGGDELLLRATIAGAGALWPDARITTLCRDVDRCRAALPDLALAADLEHARDEDELAAVLNLYEEADVVLSSPGGYLHEHYDLEGRLRSFEMVADMGKPLVLLPQSAGPFRTVALARRVQEVLDRSALVFVRDAPSRESLRGCGVRQDVVEDAADLAFYWHALAPEACRPTKGPARHLGMSVRAWPPGDERAGDEIARKAARLATELLADGSRHLTFLSTCQGVPGYVDDAEMADRVVARVPARLRERCRVDRERRAPLDLIAALGRFDAYLGMRLHGCIGAMLAGTPAMGIGYEPKTAEIFSQMGLGAYQVPQEDDADAWSVRAARFLADIDAIRADLPSRVAAMSRRAAAVFERLVSLLRSWHPARNASPEAAQESSARYGRTVNGIHEATLWRRRLPRARRLLDAHVPDGAALILVDDDRLREDLVGKRPFFPFVERDGAYGGPPSDSDAALAELERQRERGAAFLIVAWPSYWWREEYSGFFDVLRSRHPLVAQTEEVLVYDLRVVGAIGGPRAAGLDEAPRGIAERVATAGLTYLDVAALLDLKRCVRAVEDAGVHGDLLEAGCALGGSAIVMASAKAASRRFFVHDVFGMIPPPSAAEAPDVRERYELIASGGASGIRGGKYYGYEAGLLEKVRANFVEHGLPLEPNHIHLVQGLYEESLHVRSPIALAHVDCDWYDSVTTCLARIEPHLVPGGRLIVDDYFRWSGCRRAVDDYFRDRMDAYRFEPRARLHVVRTGARDPR